MLRSAVLQAGQGHTDWSDHAPLGITIPAVMQSLCSHAEQEQSLQVLTAVPKVSCKDQSVLPDGENDSIAAAQHPNEM